MVEEEHQAFLVFAHHGIERSVVSGADATVQATGILLTARRFHHHGTQGRTESQGVQTGDTYRHSHGNTELGIEYTGGSSHESYRNKYRHEDKGTGDYRHRHIAHGILGSQIRRTVTHIKLGLHSLNHNDGVVHHCTDGQYQGKQGQDVDTESGHRQKGESTNQRNDDRDRRNQRTLEVVQEEIYHQNHQDNGDNQGFDYIMDRSEQEVVHTHHLDKLRSLRQFFGHLVQQRSNLFVYRRSVGAGYLKDHESNTRYSVRFTVEAVRFTSQFYFCNVFNPKYRTVFL